MYSTYVQYTQTDTICQNDGPLVPMVGLVPIEKDVTNRTIGTKGPLELPCTQLDHMRK